jgi:hypothetical protein
MTTLDKEIRTRVAPEIKNAFSDIAKEKGLTESEFLRLLINNAISTNGGEEIKMINELKLIEKDIESKQITIRLPFFIMRAARAKAKSNGMATSRWIKSLVQSNLIQPPVMIDCAILVLEKSDRERAAVGNNLNQIARRLNESILNIESARVEIIEEVRREVKLVRIAIDELIRVSCNGWSVDNRS